MPTGCVAEPPVLARLDIGQRPAWLSWTRMTTLSVATTSPSTGTVTGTTLIGGAHGTLANVRGC